MDDGQPAHAKAYSQVSLDHGTLETAEQFIPIPDGLEKACFAGSECELEQIQSYQRAMRELVKQHGKNTDEPEEEDAQNPKKKK